MTTEIATQNNVPAEAVEKKVVPIFYFDCHMLKAEISFEACDKRREGHKYKTSNHKELITPRHWKPDPSCVGCDYQKRRLETGFDATEKLNAVAKSVEEVGNPHKGKYERRYNNV